MVWLLTWIAAGQLFLVEGAVGETAHGNGRGPGQSQGSQGLILAALQQPRRQNEEPVSIPDIAF